MSSIKSGFFGQRILLSGSASKTTEAQLIQISHKLVKLLTEKILEGGGGLVLGVGKEPLKDSATNSPSLIFDWTALETINECLDNGKCHWDSSLLGPPVMVITSEKHVREIPDSRLPLWNKLKKSGFLNVEYIQPGAHSGAMMRDRQSQFAGILIAIGGGTGVEHLARLFLDHRRPVIPFDLNLGASREDGTGGAVRLAAEAREDTHRFFSLQTEHSAISGSLFDLLTFRSGNLDVNFIVENTIDLLEKLERPTAFYTRLLNPLVPTFVHVEDFFRTVVDPVVDEAGFKRLEVGTDSTPEPFINRSIFENLHFADVAVVDLTAERPNCYMELGYAFGREIKVIMTAEDGTNLPFDPNDIPCYFWKPGQDNNERKKEFKEFWAKYINRRPLAS